MSFKGNSASRSAIENGHYNYDEESQTKFAHPIDPQCAERSQRGRSRGRVQGKPKRYAGEPLTAKDFPDGSTRLRSPTLTPTTEAIGSPTER